MLLSQVRVNNLLKVFENPKNIEPYNIIHQKEEVENTTKFINDYHLYGPPKTYKVQSQFINQVPKNENIRSSHSSLNSQNKDIKGQSTILSTNIKNLKNYEDIEVYESITNLKNGQKEYKQKTAEKILKYNNNYYPRYSQYPKYDSTTQSIAAYEYQKNDSILNSILGNSTDLANTQYLNDYNQNINNINSNNYYNYTLPYNTNSIRIREMNYVRPKSLKDIPSHPEDVMITDIPQNLAISMNPLSSSNLMGINTVPIANNQENLNQMPQEIIEKPKIIEEINTDIIPQDDINQSQPQENPINLEKLETIKETEPENIPQEVKPEGQYKITEFSGPVALPPNYSTDDEDEFNAIQILNQDISGWKLQYNKDNIKVYSKLYKMTNEKGKEVDNIMFYTDVTINHSAAEVNKQLHTYSLREKWEKSLKKGKLLKEEDLPNNLHVIDYYAYIKMPFIFADRDMVLRQKTWNDYQGEKDCSLTHLKSIEHPDYPEKEKPVRAIYENRGEYVKPINDNQCKLYLITKFDMKMNAPISMMEGKGSEGQAKWVKEFISHCGQ